MTGANSKAEPGAFGLMAEAKSTDDEPRFTLYAHDPLAVDLVKDWAVKNRARVFNAEGMSLEKRRVELLQSADAEEIAMQMVDWRRGQAATAEATTRPGFNAGADMSAQELAARERHNALVKGARTLNNLIAEAREVAAMLRGYDLPEILSAKTEAACDDLQAVSDDIVPKTVGYAHLEKADV